MLDKSDSSIKSWTTSQFDQLFAVSRSAVGPNGENHPCGVVPEKFFAAENVKPGELLKQTIRRSIACFLAVSRAERRRPDCLAERQTRRVGERG